MSLVTALHREKRIEAFSHSWMGKNSIAQYGVGKSSEHGHLHDGHDFPRFRPDHRKTDNAIIVWVDQRFQKSPCFPSRPRSQHGSHG